MKHLALIFVSILFFSSNLLGQTSIEFEHTEYDFGYVVENDGKVSHRFTFINISEEDVNLKSVSTSCGCTTPSWTREKVAPGDTGYLVATYNPKRRPGKFTKTVTVFTNNSERITLKIKGQVVKEYPIPLYEEYFVFENKKVVFQDDSYNLFIEKMLKAYEHIDTIHYKIVGSTSNVNDVKRTNTIKFLTKKQKKLQKRIQKSLKQADIEKDRLIFEKPELKIDGPKYENDYQNNRKFYDRYQYVKVIPQK